MLEVERSGGRVTVMYPDGGPFVRVLEVNVERIPGRQGATGFALCCMERQRQVRLVDSIVRALRDDKSFMLDCLAVCRPQLFDGEYGLSEVTAPWSCVMRCAASVVRNPDRVVKIALMSALPWQVRVQLLDCLKDEPVAAALVISQCCNPTEMFAAKDSTERLDAAVVMIERLMVHGGAAALTTGFAKVEKHDLARFGSWATMRGQRRLAWWIEAQCPPEMVIK